MKKLLPLFVSLIVLLVAASFALAQSGLPGAGWKSGQQIQNVSSTASATIVLTAYDSAGASSSCGSQSVGPGASYTFLTDVDCAVTAGFVGSAVASSDQPIAAIVNVNNKGTGAAAGQYRGTDGSGVATTIVFPLVKNDHKGRTTTFYVQNASNNVNTITAVFSVNGTNYQKIYSNVPANAMVVINPSDTDTPVPSGDGNVGSLVVTGTQPLAGSSLEHQTSAAVPENLQASKAFTPSDYDSKLYCPLVRYNHGGKDQTTGVQVQNVSGGNETVQIVYNLVGGGTVGPVSSPALADGASYTFLQAVDLNDGQIASATITSVGGGDIVAVVNDKGVNTSNPQRVTTYACFAAGSATTTINLPLVKEFAGINTTGVQVQNVAGDGTSATITATYTSTTGKTVSFRNSTPLADGASMTFYAISTAPADIQYLSGDALSTFGGTVNGVVLTSDKPIVAIVNESSLSGAIQDTKNYEGFNQ